MTNVTNIRATSLYTLEIKQADEPRLLQAIEALPAELTGSWNRVREQTVGVMFRARDDKHAMRIAVKAIAAHDKFVLRTGLGAHQRFIAEKS